MRITHNVIKDLLRQACAVEIIQEDMASTIFETKTNSSYGHYPFERNYEASGYYLESICHNIAEVFGWSRDWDERDEVWSCFMTTREINPFTSKDLEKELDEYIAFIARLIGVLKPRQSSLKVA